MCQTAIIPSLPALSPEILSFAAEKGVTAYVTPVLEMTRRIFPQAPITMRIEDDPEIADYRKILIEVDVGDLGVAHLLAARSQWSQGIFLCCPSTHALLFVMRLV